MEQILIQACDYKYKGKKKFRISYLNRIILQNFPYKNNKSLK